MSTTPLPLVAANELLARFITVKRWLRSDRTVRQDAFIPPKDLQLSVTRHMKLSAQELWAVGQRVVDQLTGRSSALLCGRADLHVHQVSSRELNTEAAPLVDNPNHAHITGWPAEKPAQKILAQELAAASVFHSR